MATKTKKTEEQTKKPSMDLLDLGRGARCILKLKGEIEFSKIVLWDNSNDQKGVIKATYLNIIVRDENGKEGKFIIGAKDKNLWVGKELTKEAQKKANEIAL